MRNIFRIEKNLVIGFVIQVEIRDSSYENEIWKPVIRYDHAHGFIHRDMIKSDGNKTKHKLKTQNPKEAIISAIEEIRVNLITWLYQLGYRMIENDIVNQPHLNLEIDNVKLKLLELYDNPEKINDMNSTLGIFKRGFDYTERV